ncbi:MAG: binding-protein-dependent transport system inner membrane protein [Chloroflexi bacterium OLB15]|nr:MAG: binding-protein-dependent transport system inner membrane protein [Chloroflexi bacterium OLB15]
MTAVSSSTTSAAAATRRGFHFSSKWIVHIVLFCLAVVWLVPSVGLLITSFRPREAISSSGWWTAFSPAQFTFENYEQVLTAQGMGDSFINSFKITIPGTLLPILIAAIAAYALAWMPIKGRDWILVVVLALLVIPIQTTLVPVLRLFNQFGLTGTYLGIWIAHTAYGLPFCIYLLRNFFISLPKELMESAKIDGANDLTIFWRIVIPLSVPALASLAIFQFMWVWNDLLVALVFMSDPVNQPMTVRIQAMLGTYATEWHIMSAASFISMAVPLVVFFALQRYFVTGLTAGAVKQ